MPFETSISASVGGSGTSITVNAPTGVASGDVLVAIIRGATAGAPAVASLSGWTSIARGTNGGNGLDVLRKVAGGSEPSSYTFDYDATASQRGVAIHRYSGIDNTTPEDATGTNNSGTSTSPVALGITTVTDNAISVIGTATAGAVTITEPASYTIRETFGRNKTADRTFATAGATGDQTGSLSASSGWITVHVVLRPSGGGGGTAYELDAQPGAYTLTGADAGLAWQPALDAQPGSYAVTGADAGTVHDAVLGGQPGAYVLTGADAGVAYEAAFDAQPASYAVTGADAGLAYGAVLDAQPGAYVITGADATLEDTTGGGIAYELDAQPGAYVVTGADAGLAYGAALDAQPAAYAVTGTDAALGYGAALDAQPGSYTVTGASAGTVHEAVIDAQPGAYLITGADAGFESSQDLAATAHTTVRVRAVPSVIEARAVVTTIRVRPAPSTLSVD